jgi:hypothetical protein
MNPTVVTTHSGTYAVSGSTWLSVPQGTKITDLDWVDTTPKIKRYKLQTWEVKSTSRKKPGKEAVLVPEWFNGVDCKSIVRRFESCPALKFKWEIK